MGKYYEEVEDGDDDNDVNYIMHVPPSFLPYLSYSLPPFPSPLLYLKVALCTMDKAFFICKNPTYS